MSIPPTAQQIQYMQEHINETRVPSIHISNAICLGATTISLALRFAARHYGRSGVGKDDYSILLTYLFQVSYVTSFSSSTRYGQGRHVLLVTNPRGFAICNVFNMSFYAWGMGCVKFSILLLYHRIFPEKRFRQVLLCLAALVLSWSLTGFFTSIFNCYPIEAAWDTSIKGFCINYAETTLIMGILNIMIDFVLLLTPMPLVWKLHMTTQRKILVSGVFVIGCIACVVSIARLFYARDVVSTYDPSWTNVMAGILSGLEIATGIVASCTITYRPLVERILEFVTSNPQRIAPRSDQGWNRLRVQHETFIFHDHLDIAQRRQGGQEAIQWWELHNRGKTGF
ncbi:hypothetical protein F5Y16DRAFT_423327 [Xylariaceae sp. FL0255]|nr:hypothetical protein F5Y16DRAFT_423327 [Xylariaceae sp. FL0255]